MVEEKIFFATLEEVKAFVSITSKKNYDIELLGGKYIVNGKSIMGILSLDLTTPITVKAHTENDLEFKNQIAPFLFEKNQAAVSV